MQPIIAAYEVIPLRDEISEWAPIVTKRDTTIHTASGLSACLFRIIEFVDLMPVENSHGHRASGGIAALDVEKTLWVGHHTPPSEISVD
jgi:hypothetical protein